MPDNFDKLVNRLGFDPSKKPKIAGEMFSEVLAGLKKERMEKAREKATELLRKAISLKEERDKLEKEFVGKINKFDKELGSLLGQISNMVESEAQPTLTESDQPAPSETPEVEE